MSAVEWTLGPITREEETGNPESETWSGAEPHTVLIGQATATNRLPSHQSGKQTTKDWYTEGDLKTNNDNLVQLEI